MGTTNLPVKNAIPWAVQTSTHTINIPGTASFRNVLHLFKHNLFQP